jgi:hypothetical protein
MGGLTHLESRPVRTLFMVDLVTFCHNLSLDGFLFPSSDGVSHFHSQFYVIRPAVE